MLALEEETAVQAVVDSIVFAGSKSQGVARSAPIGISLRLF